MVIMVVIGDVIKSSSTEHENDAGALDLYAITVLTKAVTKN
jgi:hypothetical protein